MEKESNPLVKQALNYGLIFGLIWVIYSLLLWMLNVSPSNFKLGILLFFINIIIYGGLLFFFSKKFRDDSLGGYINYGKALSFSVLVVLVGSAIVLVYNYIFNSFIDPDYISRTMEASKTSTENWMLERGLPEEQIEQALERMEERGTPTPIKSAIQGFIGTLIFGTIVSLITSAIVKKKQEFFETPKE